MKKETVTKLLGKLERQAKALQDEALRQDQLQAVKICRTWLELPWADMLAPVNAKLVAITTEARPLLLKEERQQPLAEDEVTRLRNARNIYGVYQQFHRKIYSTASRAGIERHIREREKAARK